MVNLSCMFSYCNKAALIAVFIAVGSFSAEADVVNLDFTIDNTVYYGAGYPSGVAGEVTGEIFGLTEGGNSSASQVEILSVPTGSGLFTGFYDLSHVSDNFTLTSSGAVTQAYFIDFGAGLLGINSNADFAYLQSSNSCNAEQIGCAVVFASYPNDGTLTFSLATPTVTPIPSTWALMLAGLTVGGYLVYRRHRQVALTQA